MGAAPNRLISICIPTYNRARYLGETLASVLPQLGPDIDLVVSDNCSTDHTREIVARYQRCWPALWYFSNHANLGFDRNVLRCLELASGEYIWFLGSDDRLKEGAVEAVRQRIIEAPTRPTLVYVNHEVTDNAGQLLVASKVGDVRDREFTSAGECLDRLGLNLGFLSALVLRRERCAQVASIAEFVGSEWIHLHVVLSCLVGGGPIEYIGRPLVRARRSVTFDNDLTKVFVEQVDRILWHAQRNGYPWLTIYRAMNRIVREQYARFALAWRCDDPEQLRRAFPILRRTCWKYPWFWLLVLPLRYAPPPFLRALRVGLRRLRGWRSARLARHLEGIQASPPAISGESLASFGLMKSRRER